MSLADLLAEKRVSVVRKWCNLVLETYPEQSRKFLKKQKDRFANPVGRTIVEGIESIYDELLHEANSDKISLYLDNIIRVRAVQDFSPSRSINFVFGLKRIIREALKEEILQGDISKELLAFESRIDGLALLCFDIYSQCRQRLSDIRVNEVKNQSARLLKMAGLVYEIPDMPQCEKGDLAEDKVNNG